jgi:hypothetical protein
MLCTIEEWVDKILEMEFGEIRHKNLPIGWVDKGVLEWTTR